MIIPCPHCGQSVVVNGLGRRPLNIPLKNICEALQAQRSVGAAAQELNCSQGYIFKVLKANGLKLKDVFRGQIEGCNIPSMTVQRALSRPDKQEDRKRIRIIKSLISAYGTFQAGSVVNIPGDVAREWVKADLAIEEI